MSSHFALALSRRALPVAAVVCLSTIGAMMAAPCLSQTPPQSEGPTTSDARPAPPDSAPQTIAAPKLKPNRPHKAKKKEKKSESAVETDAGTKTPAPAPPATPPTLAAIAAAGADVAAPLDIAARLKQEGAGQCATIMNADAAPSMIGVTQSNTVSTWSNVAPRDKHAVSVFVGQRYGASQTVPFGVTGLIASPNASGSCDSTVVQVVSSPLPCPDVRETLLRQGKAAGDLAGVQLVQTAQDQTLLMPTATNTCVLIGFHSTFRK